MAKDVVITPASGLVDFKDTLGASDATIQLDDLGNLNISNPGGELSIGASGDNLYIGDGLASVDIIFEQNGAVRALTGKTLTLGQADSFITVNALTTVPSLRSFSDTNDPAASTTMFGRDSSQGIRMHGGSSGNFISSLSSDTNPKNLIIRANRGTTNRDFTFDSSSGILTAVGFSGALTGNATTATTLQTARTINGVSFNGSSNITITAAPANAATQLLSLGVGTAASATTGEIRATNQIVAFYSDERLKENITTIKDAINKVVSLKGVTYNSNALAAKFGYNNQAEQVGVIAQDVKRVLPHAVKPAPFDIGVHEDGTEFSVSGENYMTVQYEKIVPLLIEAIKDQQKMIEEMQRKLNVDSKYTT